MRMAADRVSLFAENCERSLVITMAAPSYVPERLLLYLDILGFSALFKEAEEAEDTALWNGLESGMEAWATFMLGTRSAGYVPSKPLDHLRERLRRLQHTMFSDTIVVSAELEDFQDALDTLFSVSVLVTMTFAANGRPVRSALTLGRLTHGEHVVLGQPLIEAYNMESKEAIVPRVLVSDAVLRRMDKENAYVPIKRDVDKRWIFDVMGAIIGTTKPGQRLRIRKMIGSNLSTATEMSVYSKYAWLRDQYNAALAEPNVPADEQQL